MTNVVYLKVREADRGVFRSCHIAIDFSKEGHRQILGFLIQKGESEESWTQFFAYLKSRGLNGTQMITSDADKGLVTAIKKILY
jgi:putative transposase